MVATNSDNVNIMIAEVSSKIFGIKNVIIRLDSLKKGDIIDDPNIKIIFPSALTLDYFFELTKQEGDDK